MESEKNSAQVSPFVGVHHVGLTVANPESAARFYADAAGFVEVACANLAGLPRGLTPDAERLLRSGNAYVRLLPLLAPATARGVPRPVSEAGIVHICLQSTAIDALYQKFAVAGATFHGPLIDLGTGFLYSYARDIENNVIELEGVAPVWEDAAPWVAHVSLTSANVERLASFYAALFGNRATVSGRIGPNKKFDVISGLTGTELRAAWIPAGNMQIEVIQYLHPATIEASESHAALRSTQPGYAYICLEVSNVREASQRALAAGAHGAAVSFAMPGERCDDCFVCTDPDGNVLVLKAFQSSDAILTLNALADRDIVSRFAERREQLTNRVH